MAALAIAKANYVFVRILSYLAVSKDIYVLSIYLINYRSNRRVA